MLRKLVYGALAVAAVSATPAFAEDKSFNLGLISPGNGQTAQFIHRKRGSKNTSSTEIYASADKAFKDTVNFQLTNSGEGNGVFQIQFLKNIAGAVLKNITGAKLSLIENNSNTTVFDDVALTDDTPFLIPFVAGAFDVFSYTATISGKASGSNGGDYQITFAAPVPEPAVVGSMGAGLALAGLMAARRRRKLTLVKA